MKKITELTEVRWRTVYSRDAYGNREKDSEEYSAKRQVKSVAPGPRFGHFFIDSIAFYLVIFLAQYVFELLTHLTHFSVSLNLTIGFIFAVILFLLYPALYAFCEYKWQKTPGKFLTKTFVIDEYGNKPELKTIIARSLIRFVPFEPWTCYGDKHSNGWHDKWTKTWVVPEEELEILKKLQIEQAESN